jgi:hypothetical protein
MRMSHDAKTNEQTWRTQPLESEAPNCPDQRSEGAQGAGSQAEERTMTFTEAASIFE